MSNRYSVPTTTKGFKLKVTKAHYERLNKRLKEVIGLYSPEELQEYIRAYQANKKFKNWRVAWLWSMYRHANTDLTIRDMMHYGNYLDAHIETALKKSIGHLIYP